MRETGDGGKKTEGRMQETESRTRAPVNGMRDALRCFSHERLPFMTHQPPKWATRFAAVIAVGICVCPAWAQQSGVAR